MLRTIKQIIQTCDFCQRTKTDSTVQQGPLMPIPTYAPFERVHIDLVGPMARSDNHIYILVIVDAFTRWTEAIPLTNKKAETIAKTILQTWVCRYGWMNYLHSDNGTEFENKILHDICDWVGIIKTKTTPYHPAGNGMVERMNRVIREAITIICEQYGSKWTDALPFALWSIRSAVNRVSGFSPYELLFGHAMRMPYDYTCLDDAGQKLYSKYVQELVETIRETQVKAVGILKASRAKMKIQYDRHALLRRFQPGDLVLVRRKRRPSEEAPGEKFWFRWEGPYEVVLAWQDNSYKKYRFLLQAPNGGLRIEPRAQELSNPPGSGLNICTT